MISGEFRTAGSLKEFYDELESIRKDKVKILVWQTDEANERQKMYGIMKSYLANKIKTTINIIPDESISFNQGKSIFIYAEELGLLFKGSYDSYVNNTLKITADDKVLLKEKREEIRLNFSYTKVLTDILIEGKVPFNNLMVKDISKNGVGLICHEKLMKGLKLGMEVELVSIHSINLPRPINGTITHKSKSSKHNKLKSGFYQIGIKFEYSSKLIKSVMDQLNLKT